MPDVLFSDGTVGATRDECLEQMSYLAKDAFATYVQDGSHPELNALRQAAEADGKIAFAKYDNPANADEFFMRFYISAATDGAMQDLLRLLRGLALIYGGSSYSEDDQYVVINPTLAQSWADKVEEFLAAAA